jgi:drug/metabolite transporter (DMT)-like permease
VSPTDDQYGTSIDRMRPDEAIPFTGMDIEILIVIGFVILMIGIGCWAIAMERGRQ